MKAFKVHLKQVMHGEDIGAVTKAREEREDYFCPSKCIRMYKKISKTFPVP